MSEKRRADKQLLNGLLPRRPAPSSEPLFRIWLSGVPRPAVCMEKVGVCLLKITLKKKEIPKNEKGEIQLVRGRPFKARHHRTARETEGAWRWKNFRAVELQPKRQDTQPKWCLIAPFSQICLSGALLAAWGIGHVFFSAEAVQRWLLTLWCRQVSTHSFSWIGRGWCLERRNICDFHFFLRRTNVSVIVPFFRSTNTGVISRCLLSGLEWAE